MPKGIREGDTIYVTMPHIDLYSVPANVVSITNDWFRVKFQDIVNKEADKIFGSLACRNSDGSYWIIDQDLENKSLIANDQKTYKQIFAEISLDDNNKIKPRIRWYNKGRLEDED